MEKSLHSPNLGRGSNHGFPARNPRMGAAQRVSGLGPSRSVTGFLQSARLERSSPAAPDGTSFQNVPLEWARGGSWRRRPIAIEIHGLRLRRPLFASRRSSHRHIVTGWRSLGGKSNRLLHPVTHAEMDRCLGSRYRSGTKVTYHGDTVTTSISYALYIKAIQGSSAHRHRAKTAQPASLPTSPRRRALPAIIRHDLQSPPAADGIARLL